MRQVAHMFFDRLWQRWPMARQEAYDLMRAKMELKGELHIGELDEAQCESLIDLVQNEIGQMKATATGARFDEVEEVRAELEGPFECSKCGGHLMVDATYLDQVSLKITCPYCQNVGNVKAS